MSPIISSFILYFEKFLIFFQTIYYYFVLVWINFLDKFKTVFVYYLNKKLFFLICKDWLNIEIKFWNFLFFFLIEKLFSKYLLFGKIFHIVSLKIQILSIIYKYVVIFSTALSFKDPSKILHISKKQYLNKNIIFSVKILNELYYFN